jgi:guanylate kinase
MNEGNLFIVMAPSGAGKTSLVNALVEREGRTNLRISISHTTRPKRPGEIDGENYYFVDDATFMAMLENSEFIESAEVYGHRYGTSQLWVKDTLRSGVSVILEIDWQGAAQIRHIMPDACTIFILPPSVETLRERLTQRAQDDPDTIERRMTQAAEDISHVAEADFVVVNADFDTALEDLQAIIRSQRLTWDYQARNQPDMLGRLADTAG